MSRGATNSWEKKYKKSQNEIFIYRKSRSDDRLVIQKEQMRL